MIWGHCERCDRWFADEDGKAFVCPSCGRRPIRIEHRACVVRPGHDHRRGRRTRPGSRAR